MTDDRITMLGDPIEQHIFSGVFEGVTVALYKLPTWADPSTGSGQAAGTHFAALVDPDETQVMPIGSEAEARRAYRDTIDEILAEEAREMAFLAQMATETTLH